MSASVNSIYEAVVRSFNTQTKVATVVMPGTYGLTPIEAEPFLSNYNSIDDVVLLAPGDHVMVTIVENDFPRWLSVWATGGGVPSMRRIDTALPLTGGGDLSGDLTLNVNTFAGSARGVVPASAGTLTYFLRADGSWATPSAVAGGGISGITVREQTVTRDTDIIALDFGAGFDVTESPENEVNIALDLSEYTGAALPAGKLDVFTTTINGAVPAPGAVDQNKFLRTDGVWSVPTDVMWVGPSAPADPDTEVWYDTDVTPPGMVGIVTDGDKGDITVGNNATTLTIDAGAVSNGKMAFMSAFSLKGNDTAAPAAPADLTALQSKILLGLQNVDNTTDLLKPISTATQTALNAKQPLDADLTDLAIRWTTATLLGPSSLAFREDTDFGTNQAVLTGPASMAADRVVTLPDATTTLVGTDFAQTLTNKTIALGSNTVSGTLAQFNTAVTDADLVPAARTVSTTAPLQGGGDLTLNRSLTVDTFSPTGAGVVPASGAADTTKFLSAAGTWITPSATSGGGLTQATADGLYLSKVSGGAVGGAVSVTGGITATTADIVATVGFVRARSSLRVINGGPGGAPATQMLFGYLGAETYCHSIETSHNASGVTNNALRFKLWKLGDPMTVPSNIVLTLDGALITSTVPITLPNDPTVPLQAATKQYTDLIEARERSKGGGLVTNGTGYLGNITNFNNGGTIFTTADRPVGTSGSFLTNTPLYQTFNTDEFIPVNVNAYYYVGAWARETSGAAVGANIYLGIWPHDIDGLGIQVTNVMYQANTTTTLAADLINGATTVQLTSAANWNNAATTNTHYRSFIFWNYVDGTGYTWPTQTYSRNVFMNVYDDGAISGNTITLRVPWSGGTFPAGHPVSNGSAGGTYMYTAWAATPSPTTWTWQDNRSALLGGGVKTDGGSYGTKFPYGTAKVKIVMLSNRVASSRTAWAGITMVETTGGDVPTGGSAGQVLSKIDSAPFNTQWIDPPEGGGGAGLVDGDMGDITVGGGGTTLTIDVGAVTNVKLANLNSGEFKARSSAGSGQVENVSAAQARTMLSINNVDNTSDAAKPISTAQQTALDGKQPIDTDLTVIAALSPTNDTILQRKVGVWVASAPATVKTDLALTKSDVGLANVDDTNDLAKPVSAATQTALNAKLNISGGVVTGDVQLMSPQQTNIASAARYDHVQTKLPLAGGTMLGEIVLTSADPVAQYAAANADWTMRWINLVGATKAPLRQVTTYTLATTYALTATDEATYVWYNGATACTVTVPLNASVPLPVGYRVDVFQTSSGRVTFSFGGGAGAYYTPSATLRSVNSAASLVKVGAPDYWLLTGDLG